MPKQVIVLQGFLERPSGVPLQGPPCRALLVGWPGGLRFWLGLISALGRLDLASGFGLVWLDFGWLWIDFGWIVVGFCLIWLSFTRILVGFGLILVWLDLDLA